jgi:SPASM domain peptide maturase of grasp-with-spasm system
MYLNTQTIEENTSFKIYTDCIPVKGHARSTICDLTRKRFVFIPNALYDIITLHKGKTIKAVKAAYNNQYDATIDEYFSYLLNEEMVFFTDSSDAFPDIDISTWDEPHTILQCIIDINHEVDYIDVNLVKSLEILECQSLQLRCFHTISIAFISKTLDLFEKTCIENIEIILPYQQEIPFSDYEKLSNRFYRLSRLILTNAPTDEHKSVAGKNTMGHIIFAKSTVSSHQCCGMIAPKYFSVNLKLFSESQKYNTCLNRKISIDSNGFIRNCPSMKQHFGHIKNTDLTEALAKKGFKSYWKINKDKIKVCQDCEFRHICSDCRAYTEVPEDKYSKPLKCGYNPYTNEWEEWSKNPLKENAIWHYQLEDI